MKRIYIVVLGTCMVLSLLLISCGRDDINVQVEAVAGTADQGLDLEALGVLAGQSKDAEDFERKLNQKGGVNNLDLDQDGKVEFLKVESEDEGATKILRITAVLSESGENQHVADIQVEREGQTETANVQIQGNENIYGRNAYHHSHFGFGDYLMLRWMFGGFYRPYYSPFGFGFYPRYHGFYRPVPYGAYAGRARTITRSSSSGQRFSKSNSNRLSSNPSSRGKASSSKVSSQMKNPTRSQAAFRQTKQRAARSRASGFGRRSSGRFGGRRGK